MAEGNVKSSRRRSTRLLKIPPEIDDIKAASVRSKRRAPSAPSSSTSSSTSEPSHNSSQLIWYFAYGSNMSKTTLTDRRGIHPKEKRPARLYKWHLTFDLKGCPWVDPGFGNIQPSETEFVDGVANLITEDGFQQILRSELQSSQGGYIPLELFAEAYDGQKIPIRTLRVDCPHLLCEEAKPSTRYMFVTASCHVALEHRTIFGFIDHLKALLIEGAKQNRLAEFYIRYLESIPTEPIRPLSHLIEWVVMKPFRIAITSASNHSTLKYWLPIYIFDLYIFVTDILRSIERATWPALILVPLLSLAPLLLFLPWIGIL